MSNLCEKSITYLDQVCCISHASLVAENENQITFQVPQKDFINSFSHMEKTYGEYKAYPLDEYRIEAVWCMVPMQHIIFVTDLSEETPTFFVSLMNAVEHTPSLMAKELMKINEACDSLMTTPAWENLGKSGNLIEQARDIELEGKKLGLIK